MAARAAQPSAWPPVQQTEKTTVQKPLYKTTIVIWSEFDGDAVELTTLAQEAESGTAYCSKYRSEGILEPTQDPDWDGTEFFGIEGDDGPTGEANG